MHSPTKKLLYDAFILATLVLQVQSCNLTGMWQNELGSTLHVQAVGSELTGMYKTKVGTGSQESGPDQVGKLVGVVSHHDQQTSVAFSVLWETGSCSSWVGQCFPLPDGKRILKTLWMLRSMALSPADNWKSTRMGEDTFILEH